MKALCFGSLNLDHTYRLHHFLQPGETNHALNYDILPGGKGLNQAIALARAGMETSMAGCIGGGGESLTAFLEENHVDTHLLRTAEVPTGHTVIQVEDSGENCILVYPGANHTLTEEQIFETVRQFAPGDLLLAQNETNLVGTILKAAKKQGMMTVFNPSPMTDALKETLPLEAVDWLIVNETELAALTGQSEPREAMEQLQSCYPDCKLVVTLGSDGAVCYDGRQVIRQDAYPVCAVDTTAAGDTFTGYFFGTYQETGEAKSALKRAAAAAAMAATKHGAAASIPVPGDVDIFIREAKI